jgi:hypothetical protein
MIKASTSPYSNIRLAKPKHFEFSRVQELLYGVGPTIRVEIKLNRIQRMGTASANSEVAGWSKLAGWDYCATLPNKGAETNKKGPAGYPSKNAWVFPGGAPDLRQTCLRIL